MDIQKIRIESRYLFLSPFAPAFEKKVGEILPGAAEQTSESSFVTCWRELQRVGLSSAFLSAAEEFLASVDPEKDNDRLRLLAVPYFYGLLEKQSSDEAREFLVIHREWLTADPLLYTYLQLTLEFVRENWMAVLHFIEKLEKAAQEAGEAGWFECCDAQIKAYLAAVHMQKPRAAVHYLERFSCDKRLTAEAARKTLDWLKDHNYIYISSFLRKVWPQLGHPAEILDLHRGFPLEDLHEQERNLLAEIAEKQARAHPSLEAGKILLRLERFEAAAQTLSQVGGADWTRVEARFLAAQAFLETGRFEKAKAALEEVRNIDPTHTEAGMLLEALDPVVGEVFDMSGTRAEEETLLTTAARACSRYFEINQQELALFLFKSMLQVAHAEEEEAPFDPDQLGLYLARLEKYARERNFVEFLKQLQPLKDNVRRFQLINLNEW